MERSNDPPGVHSWTRKPSYAFQERDVLQVREGAAPTMQKRLATGSPSWGLRGRKSTFCNRAVKQGPVAGRRAPPLPWPSEDGEEESSSL